jgi:diaminopimelate decarboxylase
VSANTSRLIHPALPRNASVDPAGALSIAGVGIAALAATYGTPLYVYDADDIRGRVAECISGLGSIGTLHYAAKAYLSPWLLRLLMEFDVGVDVCSPSEMAIVLRSGLPSSRVRLHGNNKSRQSLQAALTSKIGAIVVDGTQELQDVIDIARDQRLIAPILLRLNPGIEAHTHRYLQTGILDSKFGLPIATGDARTAVLAALAAHDAVRLIGFHAHIGTQILNTEPYNLLLNTLVGFAHAMQSETQFWPAEISPGGGVGITYTDEEHPALSEWAGNLRKGIADQAGPHIPRLSVELGRSIIGSAGLAIYTAGSIKRIPGIRTYLSVDGGMADNIRPALYKARYAALVANRMHDAPAQTITIAGPYCESGDILVDTVDLPNVERGDLIVLPAAGAYCLPMSSNYNGALRPAVVAVEDGTARLVQRRQSLDDLMALEMD